MCRKLNRRRLYEKGDCIEAMQIMIRFSYFSYKQFFIIYLSYLYGIASTEKDL